MTNTLLRLCCVLVLAHSAQDSARAGAALDDRSRQLTVTGPEPTVSPGPTLSPAPTAFVSFNVIAELRIVGLSCAAYGTAEEAALGGALADVLEFVTEDSLTDSECVDVLQAYSYTYSSNATNASCVELYNVTRDLCTWTTVDSDAYSASTACQEACLASDDCFAIQWHADGTEGWCDT